MENLKTNRTAILRFYDAFNEKNEAILDEVIADDYVDYGHQPPGQGKEGAKSDYRAFIGGFKDARFDIDEMIEAGDRVVVRWTSRGTHTGSFAGLPPTQKKVEVRGISIYRLKDGKIIETRNMADIFGMLTQLGAIGQKPKAA